MTDTPVHERFRLDDESIQRDPFAYYPGLRQDTPVLRTELGGNPCWVLSRHEDITAALRDPGTFSSRTTPVPTVLHMDPPDQQRMRAMVSSLFTRNTVSSMEPFIETRCDELIDELQVTGGGDIVVDFAGPLTVSVMARLLGISIDNVETLRRSTRLSAEYVRAMRLGITASPEAAAASVQLLDFATDIVRSGHYTADGVIATLAQLAADGDLSEIECSHFIVLLIVAGHTTTTNLISNSLFTLAQRPGDLARLRDEPAYTQKFIEEVLRTRPSFQRILRVTTRDVLVSGTQIPAGSTVYLLLGSANRDSNVFEDPELFDADQRREMHFAFGFGIHTCLGQWLARLEANTALTSVAARMSSITLDPERRPEHLAGGTYNEFGFEHLPVRVQTLTDGRSQVTGSQTRTKNRSHTELTLGHGREFEVDARVTTKVLCANDVAALELSRADDEPFPVWKPGAHIDLILPAAPTRQYSLCGTPADQHTWRIGVLRDEAGRGSSRYVHDELEAGATVRVRGPRNNFSLVASPRYLFIAGGIGITPLLPMIAQVDAAGSDWSLVYGGRERRSMGFVSELEAYGPRVSIMPQDETGLLDLDTLLGSPQDDTLVYCCGPEPLLAAVEDRCRNWPSDALHVERFQPRPVDDSTEQTAFDVVLGQSDMTLAVPIGLSILDVVEEAGVFVLASCREGTCGTCETRVIEGRPEHRDSVLDEHVRASNECIMICVSRSKTPRLVLDL
jgi:cytochrome P450/ferredoxin-NADP reductase